MKKGGDKKYLNIYGFSGYRYVWKLIRKKYEKTLAEVVY